MDLSQPKRTMTLLNIGLTRSLLRGVEAATDCSIGILASKTHHQLGIISLAAGFRDLDSIGELSWSHLTMWTVGGLKLIPTPYRTDTSLTLMDLATSICGKENLSTCSKPAISATSTRFMRLPSSTRLRSMPSVQVILPLSAVSNSMMRIPTLEAPHSEEHHLELCPTMKLVTQRLKQDPPGQQTSILLRRPHPMKLGNICHPPRRKSY